MQGHFTEKFFKQQAIQSGINVNLRTLFRLAKQAFFMYNENSLICIDSIQQATVDKNPAGARQIKQVVQSVFFVARSEDFLNRKRYNVELLYIWVL